MSPLPSEQENLEAAEVGIAPPPDGFEFMDGDIFVFIKNNDVCICSTVLREAAIETYCVNLFKKAKLGDQSQLFELQKVGNADRLKLINAEGVKAIELNATLYQASVDYIKRKTEVVGALGAVGRHISAMFGTDKAPAGDNISVRLTLITDDRMKNGRALGSSKMKSIAKELADGDEDYVIVTRKGQRITANEVYIREKVEIERHGKSVDRKGAWAALASFHGRLVESGIAGQ